LVSVACEDDSWTYFHGGLPVFWHRADDRKLFRLITAQLISAGACRQVDVIRTFGVTKNCLIRAVNKLRTSGPDAFFEPRKSRQGGTKLHPQALKKAQQLLDKQTSRKETAEALGIKYDTLRKAINDGRLRENFSPTPASENATSKSSRGKIDADAADGIGTACTRVEERVLAAVGKCNGVPSSFEACLDVPNGGVLCAIPALLANGLVQDTDKLLGPVKGYYSLLHILLLLAFMTLCRIKTVERLRGRAPGEFGKLLGLDRIPEVRCLRKKMDDLSTGDAASRWAAHLSQHWMVADPDAVGSLYVDGHVRVYHGGLTKLPRRFVSRERLCLRGTSDYWVNDAIGRPFFVVEKTVDPGMLQTLRNDIVPRLLTEVPGQPSQQELDTNPHCCRFILVFDREGYSPSFFADMWKAHRIACMTYHKHPDEAWPTEWFSEQEVRMPSGEMVTMALAERGSLVGTGKKAMWMREVRKLTDSGHQTSLISTAYELPHTGLALRMFSRWCQENFFRYMMQHFSIDLLREYGLVDLPGTEKLVNPAWRELNRQRMSIQNKLRYRHARFGEMTHHTESGEDQKKYAKWVSKKSELLEEIEELEHQLEELKAALKNKPKHIAWNQLEDKDKFQRLAPERKRLMDTIGMIVYRTETAMAGNLISPTVDLPAARRLLQDLYVTEADILPEPDNSLLRVRVHGASRPAANRAMEKLFDTLNKAQVCYPGTTLRLRYELGVKIRNSDGA